MKQRTIQIPIQEAPAVPKLAYTVEEAAEALSVGRTMIFYLLRDKKIISIKIGRRTLIPLAEIHAFIDRMQAETGA